MRWITSAMLATVLTACLGEGPIAPAAPPVPTLVSAAAEANPHNAISTVVRIRATAVDSVAVRYAKGDVPVAVPAAVPADSVAVVPVVGLAPATAYDLVVLLFAGDSAIVGDTLAFTTGSLPAWVPALGAAGSDTTPGYVLLSLPLGPVIVDNTGTVVWYREAADGTLTSFTAHPNGRYTLAGVNDLVQQFLVLDVLGTAVDTLRCVDRQTRFHDVYLGPAGDAWLLCDDVRTMDLTGYGGQPDARVTWTVVQHVDADGTLLFEWNSADHLSLDDVPPTELLGVAVNATHGNAIALDADGNVLVSFRTLDEVAKVDVATGAILWRFGGRANQFTLVGDSRGGFARQHGLRPAGPGQIQMLDNGATAPSRLVRYLVNPQTLTATLVLDVRDTPATVTPVGGNAQYYPNGYGLVSFGRAGRVLETDPTGNRAWELTGLDGIYVFRAQRIPSLYEPGGAVTPPHAVP